MKTMKKTAKTDFQVFTEALEDADRSKLGKYILDLQQHIALAQTQKQIMLGDFYNAIMFYVNSGMSLDDALERLEPQKLGGFYAHPPIRWYPLDYAAKIYPLSMKQGQMSVFRLSIYLKQDVIPELLQIALTFTIKRFPSFATTLKRGFFWHYLDSTKRRFSVEPEQDLPCKPLCISTSGSQSFRVLYYENRISIEFFHVLTDGTGGLVFLKTLAAEYLRLLGYSIPPVGGVWDVDGIPSADEISNDFLKVDMCKENSGFIGGLAIQMSGRLSHIKPCRILHLEIAADELKAVAKSKSVTITAFMLALMFMASKFATEEMKGNVQIQVPVNMRKFYDSHTIRNFSLYCSVCLPLSEICDIGRILPQITRQLQEKASQSAMGEMMSTTVKLVRSLKFVPLCIKNPVAKIAYGFLGDRIFTNTLSNLGVINVPEEMSPHIEKFDFVIGAGSTNRAACAIGTFGNTTVFSILKLTADPSFEEKICQLLSDYGIRPRVSGSAVYES